MHLLFADRMPEQTIVDLEARGHTCVMEPGLAADELAGRIAGFDGLVVRSTKVRRAVFEAADRLVLVIRAGAGTNTIDTDAAASHGVFVCNVPGRNAAAVAELTLGLLLAIDRRIADNVRDVRDGHWDKQRYSKAEGLLGSTMGIIGLGSIGFSVAERAAAFGIRVQALAKPDRSAAASARAEELGITMCDSLEELVSTSDIVTLHVPSNAATKHLVDDGLPGPDEEGRDPAQHLEGRRGRRATPCSRRWTPAPCGPAWTCSPTNPVTARARGTRRSPGTRTSSRPTTSARRRCRRSARSRRA